MLVLQLVCRGLRNKEIAERLGVHEPAIKKQVGRLMRYFAASSRTELLREAVLSGVVQIGEEPGYAPDAV